MGHYTTGRKFEGGGWVFDWKPLTDMPSAITLLWVRNKHEEQIEAVWNGEEVVLLGGFTSGDAVEFTEMECRGALAIAKKLRPAMRCNCDLDKWAPESSTGHSHVCRIHHAAIRIHGKKTPECETCQGEGKVYPLERHKTGESAGGVDRTVLQFVCVECPDCDGDCCKGAGNGIPS